MSRRPPSLRAQLQWRLGAAFLLATLLALCALAFEGARAARSLGDDELERRARQIAQFVRPDADGRPLLALPPRLDWLYHAPSHTRMLVVRDAAGGLIAASDPAFAAQIERWPAPGGARRAFHLREFGSTSEDYNGVSVRIATAAGPMYITVAAISDAEALAEGVVDGFIRHWAWAIPLFMAAMLGVASWSVRRGLRPVWAASEQAAAIGPESTRVRLPVRDLPAELLPLVEAVNRALDRLERGFDVQRQFTANAAHELRTPLAILTAGLDQLSSTREVETLRVDAERMNRVLAQLLRVARLDAVPLDVSGKLDLGATVAQVLAYLTPWALGQERLLGYDAPTMPVWVRGNADAVGDAVRNLVENAVHHAPPGTEVAVTVAVDGTVTVADHGPGVAPEDRPHLFERFWRGRGQRRQGAGLGLAIVAEIMRAHRGQIEVADAAGGGALFRLRFQTG